MNGKIKQIAERTWRAVLNNPSEVVMSALFFILACIKEDDYTFPVGLMLFYFPCFFLITHTLNYLTRSKRYRFIYYLSVLFCLLLYGQGSTPKWSTYLVSLIVSQFIYVIVFWDKENTLFIKRGLNFLKALFSSLLLSTIVWLLLLSIYYSIRYIFDWDYGYSSMEEYMAFFAYFFVCPILFLVFNDRKDREGEEGANRLFEVLLNYVLSPALLIYAAILYVYFIKITVLWSLPKGGIAYIVVSFTLTVFFLKGCQVFLRKTYYGWFYQYASFVVLPALIMYWAGACYRIMQYGFTELRVYLVVVGVILTCGTFLFLSERYGRYLYVACLSVVLLSAVTYIPFITAEDIERYSQSGRPPDGYEREERDKVNYVTIESNLPVDVSGYKTLQPVKSYSRDQSVWMGYYSGRDSVYLFSAENDTLFQSTISDLWKRQMAKAGLSPGDSIPEAAYPALLQVDLDSARLVLERISLFVNHTKDSTAVNYMEAGYYLKK